MQKTILRSAAAIALALVTTAAVCVAPAGVGAATFDGVLGIHGPGTLFAGTGASGIDGGAYVSLTAAPGGVATFPAGVLNTGSTLAQYQVNLGAVDGASTPQLLSAGVDVTALARATNGSGFGTAPLAPGKSQALTLKIKVPPNATPEQSFYAALNLWAPAKTQYLGTVYAFVTVKASTGNTDHDVFATSGSQPTVRGTVASTPSMTAPTVKVNGVATFTITVKNDGAAPDQVLFGVLPQSSCSTASFAAAVRFGTVDVTSDAFGSGWLTPILNPRESVKLTMTVKSVLPHPPSACANNQRYLIATGVSGSNPNRIFLIVNGWN